MNKQTSQELLDFIQSSPSMFHTVKTVRTELEQAGFTYLPEGSRWALEKGGKYYTIRNHSSIIAFTVGAELDNYHFQMSAAHSDSPTFKVKSVPELTGPNEYLRLDVEGYGGMIDYTWLDRPLSIAGRVLVQNGTRMETKLLYIDKDILIIPSLCIHMNRGVNDGYAFNHKTDLCPLFSTGALKKGDFDKMVAEELGVQPDQILAKDLFLVNRQAPSIWGYKDEFVSSPKLDDLQCAFVSLKGFLNAKNTHGVNVYCCFDNEEVGSNTKQGAMSTFLHDVLTRINGALGKDEDAYYQAVSKSFLVSCDNAHAVHPNHGDKTDAVNYAMMNKGPVIKEAANQKYTTDAFSRGLFTYICKKAGVPVQTFANRSDMAGGSTLGNLSNTQVSVHAVDIGLPQLAMHSSYETAGIADTDYAIDALTAYFNADLHIDEAAAVDFE
ncbi:M18 family aminopeptidase [Catenisphaera adipataccumulans]|jgi:aspartyl aminopeptidase|uniref:M18 family aminopeptidase n=1 Tax=Catenisphaera adipataccumulans TaxID=700500 RepID=A0A7W8CZW6_9FIRM|nr:M18 family aminopeptidase [Catenisphaera adipataccumulans]MBB5183528.1 aspartyl aminopeptidase [Catenisphaera adipataccumulans]